MWYIRIDAGVERTEIYVLMYFPSKSKMALRKVKCDFSMWYWGCAALKSQLWSYQASLGSVLPLWTLTTAPENDKWSELIEHFSCHATSQSAHSHLLRCVLLWGSIGFLILQPMIFFPASCFSWKAKFKTLAPPPVPQFHYFVACSLPFIFPARFPDTWLYFGYQHCNDVRSKLWCEAQFFKQLTGSYPLSFQNFILFFSL